ncbi:PhoX family protein [Thermomonospora cellulosilytica]|uniref:Secreted PhoX family phosphatase n=1 Tax=Thermomonospora cellulosilytica TaxID=1411118 RepID=A0A7W3R6Q4_9ACTN|nr:PhoX family phosphatase [Thermomonospora cellulosilytica]MBA9001694.1 secreted PhoX family phosphatase [Thermomonospora cellulosilytica]
MTAQDVRTVADPDDISSNPSGNATFREVAQARMSRRSVIRGGTVVAAAGFLGAGVGTGTAAAAPERHGGSKPRPLGFKAVPAGTADAIAVPEGYTAQVLIPWGTPLHSRGPQWRKDASNTAAEQAAQVGMHHDGMSFFPLGAGPLGSRQGLLVLNHEYVDQVLLFPDGDAQMTKAKVDKALAAHGVTIAKVVQGKDGWKLADSRYNRRVTGSTPVTFSGPVGPDHPALQAENPPMGTLNNCSNGQTPWGTYLACEENWNGYFGTTDAAWKPNAQQARYGVAANSGYRWHTVDPRFDVAVNPNEINRFGWVVEIDPFDPDSTPVKRTALGRIKHEGATVTESRGRIVVYTGDDQDGEYVYKFVGSAPWRQLRALRRSPLDHGTLYVAKFNDDGSGEWLPLKHGTGPLTEANGWADQADVLLRTREAADAVGATKLDRPEWVAVHPDNKDVYLTLTNGSGWNNAVNPRKPNPYGHIVRWRERGGDNTALTFEWDIFLLAGDPEYDPRVELAAEDVFGSPDGLGFDRAGRLWIQTDVSNSVQNRPDRQHDNIGNNQMLVADPGTGEIRRFLVGPRGCEVTGFAMTPDQRTLFVNIQHPGEATPFWGAAPTPQNPNAVSSWPDHDSASRPRSATVVIRKKDGGVIGT